MKTRRKRSRISQRISFSKFTNKQSDPPMVNDSEDEQNAQTDPQLKTKLEKIQKKSKSKKMTDEKNVKSEGRVKGLDILSKKQRDAVRSMGFGKLLSLKVDGIPAKLGHYVVDKFDPERMEINLGNVQINVDNESVHQLLGIPNGGKKLTSLTYKKKLEGNVKSWRNLYEEKYVASPDIVKRISQSSDDDSILFKLDFLVLFMSTMVEIQKHGKCKLDFIHYITDDTDLGGIDWCSYIINSMKKCKEGWERCNLLHVDRVNCPSENVERNMRPIQFWTMNALHSREECEINNGGFGLGELRELYVDLKGDESDVDEKCNEKEPNMENLSDDFFQPDNLTVKEFVEKYKFVYKEIIDVEKDVADTEKDIAADTEKDVEKDVADNEKDVVDTNWTQFFNNNLEEIIICENAKKVGTKEKENEGIDTEVKEKESIDTEVKEKESETINTEVKVEEIIDTEKKEKEIIEPTLPNFSFKLSQSTQDRRKNQKNDIFGIGYGLESKKFLFASLNPGVGVYGNAIDYWAVVLNYEEKFRNPESLNRLFFRMDDYQK
ncbi:hypothetical protein L1987_19827 [Smallanthus sonchifolius]|uniref:Uncharacterized protein n=1 Tax=Smallanthus sonchifolius TaxID=185202 RepID=A0ACB9IQW3_9ASTR|nr:hypothetical protein L1987_19827 [Smallanthus sonchifolius]